MNPQVIAAHRLRNMNDGSCRLKLLTNDVPE